METETARRPSVLARLVTFITACFGSQCSDQPGQDSMAESYTTSQTKSVKDVDERNARIVRVTGLESQFYSLRAEYTNIQREFESRERLCEELARKNASSLDQQKVVEEEHFQEHLAAKEAPQSPEELEVKLEAAEAQLALNVELIQKAESKLRSLHEENECLKVVTAQLDYFRKIVQDMDD